MNKLGIIVAREYLNRVRTRSFLIATILFPLFISAIMVGPVLLMERTGASQRVVAVYDATGGAVFGSLQTQLGDPQVGGSGNIQLQWQDGSDVQRMRDQLEPLVSDGQLDGFLVLPADFLTTGQAQFYSADPSGVVWTEVIEDGLGRVLVEQRLSEYGLSEGDLAHLMSGADLDALDIAATEMTEADMGVRLAVGFVMIFMLYLMILIYGIQAMNGIIEDKSSRVVEVMLASVTPTQLMAGKILSAALVGGTQFAIWGIVVVGLLGQTMIALPFAFSFSFLTPELWLSFMIFFVLGFLLFSCIYAAIGALCNSTQDAQQFQTPVTLLVVIPMVLMQVVMEDPNSTLAMGMSLFPFFAPIMMFMRIVMGSPPFWQIVLSVVILAATVLLMAKLAAKLFRLSILSYGKAPGWTQVLRMIRSPE